MRVMSGHGGSKRTGRAGACRRCRRTHLPSGVGARRGSGPQLRRPVRVHARNDCGYSVRPHAASLCVPVQKKAASGCERGHGHIPPPSFRTAESADALLLHLAGVAGHRLDCGGVINGQAVAEALYPQLRVAIAGTKRVRKAASAHERRTHCAHGRYPTQRHASGMPPTRRCHAGAPLTAATHLIDGNARVGVEACERQRDVVVQLHELAQRARVLQLRGCPLLHAHDNARGATHAHNRGTLC